MVNNLDEHEFFISHQERRNSASISSSSSLPSCVPCDSAIHSSKVANPLLSYPFLSLVITLLPLYFTVNLMAPLLTPMAATFGWDGSPSSRDYYLGSNLSLAFGVFSLPLAAAAGYLSDALPPSSSGRIAVYSACNIANGIFDLAPAVYPRSYFVLYVSRLVGGAASCAATTVAFSIMGDLLPVNRRNAGSACLMAAMGAGMLFGQVYAGFSGEIYGWTHPFAVSGMLSVVAGIWSFFWMVEPLRGATEEALKGLYGEGGAGGSYDKALDWEGFMHAMGRNRSNFILILQNFTNAIPWGLIFVFLNDFLSQERKLPVDQATTLVAMFGIGAAVGGGAGGCLGQWAARVDRRFLPAYMSFATFVAIFPTLAIINAPYDSVSWASISYSLLSGCTANLAGVNVRPAVINVNPPEVRGVSMTAANLVINLGRGIGPAFVTILGQWARSDRKQSFNILITFCWTLTAVLLLLLVWTLPADEDRMAEGLRQYVVAAQKLKKEKNRDDMIINNKPVSASPDEESVGLLLGNVEMRTMRKGVES